ncbi:helix-turn-helix domain-containing protein [Sphingomonas flavalba]|uniref:helix-turn-helix domain-containing protein n=1 Tax=Sphingomonas flavalba TaxID=2559804 RepID=UPI00109DD2F1|nr:helix-turn-helix domain-containing protein [Sphingomonas flavalba]
MADFTTAVMHPDDGREAWRERMAALCGRRAAVQFSPEPFTGSIRHREVGGVSICHFKHNIRQLAQDRRSLEADQSRYIMLIMQLGGRSQVSQSNNDLMLSAGAFAIIDSFRPFVTRFDGPTSQLIAYLPAAEFTGPTASSGLARPYAMSGQEGLGALARSTLLTIARSADRLLDDDAVVAREMLTGVVRRMIGREGRPRAEAEGLPGGRIRAFIDARLADPELSPARIARGCGISVRRLHRAFAGTEWSVCSWIRHCRLEACRRDLLDPTLAGLSIIQIAFRWGFNDAAHFSRSFREAYGASPREHRRECRLSRNNNIPCHGEARV